jgi:protein ImuA
MGTASPPPTLEHLRKTLAGIDPSLKPDLGGQKRLLHLSDAIDSALGGGLACGTLHEVAPTGPIHLAAATGFALALAVLAGGQRGHTLWVASDFAAGEAGGPYGPGLGLFGLAPARLLVLRVPRADDVLWAMEEALRCRALTAVVGELTGDAPAADLTATRRLVLAGREVAGLGLLIRHRPTTVPSAAATRWEVAASPSRPDAFGGLGPPCFELSLRKNRRGPSGQWTVTWDHHEHAFHAALPVGVAETAFDRPDRTPLVHAG